MVEDALAKQAAEGCPRTITTSESLGGYKTVGEAEEGGVPGRRGR